MFPRDFRLAGPLKSHLGGECFTGDEEVETEVRKWLRQQLKDFYAAGFDALVKRRDKCINARFEVFTAVTMKNAVFWDVAPTSENKTNPRRHIPEDGILRVYQC
jgi:hypothetical protein